MPKANSSAKTASAPKIWRVIIGLCIVGLLLFIWSATAKAPEAGLLTIKDRQFNFEPADTPTAQEKGLSGRSALPFDHAMLFRFGNTGRRCFWMKDMLFKLDIIWLDGHKKIVHIEPDLAPDTYPRSYCADNTRYVVEVNAGTAQQLHLQINDTVRF